MTPRLELLSHAEVRAAWPWLRAGIDSAREHECDGMLAEDVWTAIMAGDAGCYGVKEKHGKVQSFIVARKYLTFGRSIFHVWVCFNAKGGDRIADFFPQIVDLAKSLDCSRITTESKRPLDKVTPLVAAYQVFHFEVGL